VIETLIKSGIELAIYMLEAGLFLYLLLWGRSRRRVGVSLYIGSLLAVDAVGRNWVLHHYGFQSLQYYYFFYVTDVLLALSAFLLICSFFRRACLERRQMWYNLRLLLIFVFIIVVGISGISLSQSRVAHIVEFEQNLYFTCLVLNTVLYVLIQHVHAADDELDLLTCGMGIQFAPPAANFALVFLTHGQHYIGVLQYVTPLCTLAMLALWFYAIAWKPRTAAARVEGKGVRSLAQVPVYKA